MNITPITDKQVPWECWRGPTNLVYFVHSKCASRTYDLLMRKLGWNISTTQEIDWHNDHVFSLIRDPVVKHRKGIVEYFFYNKDMVTLAKDIIDNPKWATTLSNVTCLDHHSATIYSMLGKDAELVKWIPIDTAVDHKQVTLDLLEQHGVNISDVKGWFLTLPKENKSTLTETTVFELLSAQPIPHHVLRYLDYDTILYQHVIRNA